MRISFPFVLATLLLGARAEADPPSDPPPPPPPAPAPPAVRTDLWFGVDGILMPLVTPRFGGGVAPWVTLHLNDSISLDVTVRQVWTILSAPLLNDTYNANYSSIVLAGCWHTAVFLCPVVEVGRLSYSFDQTWDNEGPDPSLVVAAGGRLMIERPFMKRRFLVRVLGEVEGVAKRASFVVDDGRHAGWTMAPVSITLGIGLGAHL